MTRYVRRGDATSARRARAEFARTAVILIVASVAVVLASTGRTLAAPRKFETKPCLACHTQFAEQIRPLKVVHPGIADAQCETCHIRHGIVGKLLLKKDGNALCLGCHTKESIGLDKPLIHSALEKTEKCTACHDPHASKDAALLKAEGDRKSVV